jgi:uncharacterized protein YhbP (UPF0306 family)
VAAQLGCCLLPLFSGTGLDKNKDKFFKTETNVNDRYCGNSFFFLNNKRNAITEQRKERTTVHDAQTMKLYIVTEQQNKWTKLIPRSTVILIVLG